MKDLGREQNAVHADLARLKSESEAPLKVPDQQDIEQFLVDTGDAINAARESNDETVQRQARRIIDALTGGSIELFQIGERAKSKGWLQARFQVDVVAYAIEELTGVRLRSTSNDRQNPLTQSVIIDFRKSKLIDEQAETAKRLWDEGLLYKDIASQMGCARCYVTKLIYHWFDSNNQPRPNGKKRRKTIENKQSATPLYKQIANEVHVLVESGNSNLGIAKRLGTSDFNVAKSIAWWHKTRGLPVPTVADRRRKKLARAKSMYDSGMLLKDIAKELSYSPRGLKLALDKFVDEEHDQMIDGRTRRGNAASGQSANGTNAA